MPRNPSSVASRARSYRIVEADRFDPQLPLLMRANEVLATLAISRSLLNTLMIEEILQPIRLGRTLRFRSQDILKLAGVAFVPLRLPEGVEAVEPVPEAVKMKEPA